MTERLSDLVRTAVQGLRQKTRIGPAPYDVPTFADLLEQGLLHTRPEPANGAARCAGLRRAATGLHHRPVEITAFKDARANALCTGCGAAMVRDDHGDWQLAGSEDGPA